MALEGSQPSQPTLGVSRLDFKALPPHRRRKSWLESLSGSGSGKCNPTCAAPPATHGEALQDGHSHFKARKSAKRSPRAAAARSGHRAARRESPRARTDKAPEVRLCARREIREGRHHHLRSGIVRAAGESASVPCASAQADSPGTLLKLLLRSSGTRRAADVRAATSNMCPMR